MSAVGLFGEFLVNNQLAVDAFLLVLFAALIIGYLFRALVIKPKKDAEISELIRKIDALESKLNATGQVDVVRTAADLSVEEGDAAVAGADAPVAEADREAAADGAKETDTEVEQESESDSAEEVEIVEEVSAEQETESDGALEADTEQEPEEPSFLDGKLEETLDLREFLVNNRADRDSLTIPGERFMSRTWGEDRYGNVYTEEMLKESIG